MRTAVSKVGVLCLAAALLVGCESMKQMASNTTDTVGGWFGGSDRSYFERKVGNGFAEADAMSLSRRTARALNSGKAGKIVTWRNSKTGARATIVPGQAMIEQHKFETARRKGVAVPANMTVIGKTYRAKRNANLRAGPGSKNRKVGGLAKGEKFTAVGKVGGEWIMVSMKGRAIGYVFADLVKPAKSQTSMLREELDLASGDYGDDVVIENMRVATSCRIVKFSVTLRHGDSTNDQFKACKAVDGAWEIM